MCIKAIATFQKWDHDIGNSGGLYRSTGSQLGALRQSLSGDLAINLGTEIGRTRSASFAERDLTSQKPHKQILGWC